MKYDLSPYIEEEINSLRHCTLCPHQCGAKRLEAGEGYCKSDAGFAVSSVCVHKGEEPVISGRKGVCNIFFSRCNMQCIYCQNYQISKNSSSGAGVNLPFDELISEICSVLEQTENIVGFVSPSHNIPQVMAIIRRLRETGRHPVFVYNTNGYDRVGSLKMLEDYINVYLPDFKYSDASLAFNYSQARDYPKIAALALKEMYRQKGASLIIGDNGIAGSGIIVRHLILPGSIKQSIKVLRFIAEEISPNLHISLMSQYYPVAAVKDHPYLKGTLTFKEYEQVIEAMHAFGLYRGWSQELQSNSVFQPDFSDKNPFD